MKEKVLTITYLPEKYVSLHHQLRFVVITSLISGALGFALPTYFQLVLGAVSFFNTLGKEETMMKKTLIKAVGAVAAGPEVKSLGERLV